jgi:hypothetical protein
MTLRFDQIELIDGLLPDPHFTLRQIAEQAGVDFETLLAYIDSKFQVPDLKGAAQRLPKGRGKRNRRRRP